ncbi:MAG: ISAzo13-like element transposase-related protein, partial [Promethearchaeota archaeon]
MREMKKQLNKKGINASFGTIRKKLKTYGISIKKNKKSKNSQDHPQHDEQFRFLNKKKQLFLDLRKLVISVDSKKKEIIEHFKNNG